MDGYTIRLAENDDLLKIREWLEQELRDDVGGFFNNYNLIEAGQLSGSLLALVREFDNFPVAFCLGESNIDIFAVKVDHQRQRLGSKLARYFIDAARQRDVIGLSGECVPVTSKPFWKAMGFVSVPSPWCKDNRHWVACPLPHERELPEGLRCKFEITLKDAGDQQPLFQCGSLLNGGRYTLARDFCHFIPSPNTRLEFYSDGELIFSDKVKYVKDRRGEYNSPWVRVREFMSS